MDGETVSYYLDKETIEAIKRHAEHLRSSRSYALRDLVRIGLRDVQLSTEEGHQRLKRLGWDEWANR